MALSFFVGCKDDSESDDDGGEGSGCANCNDDAEVYACYCQPEMEFVFEEEECPPPAPDNSSTVCNLQCETKYGDDTPSTVRDPPCAAESSISCTSWSPSTYITYTSGVYHVDENWLSGVIADPEPLWGCDDAVISVAGVGEFEIADASSGEALYELGLRNGDIPVLLNGEYLNSFAGAFAAFGQYLNGETDYTLVVLRSSTPFALSYEID